MSNIGREGNILEAWLTEIRKRKENPGRFRSDDRSGKKRKQSFRKILVNQNKNLKKYVTTVTNGSFI